MKLFPPFLIKIYHGRTDIYCLLKNYIESNLLIVSIHFSIGLILLFLRTSCHKQTANEDRYVVTRNGHGEFVNRATEICLEVRTSERVIV